MNKIKYYFGRLGDYIQLLGRSMLLAISVMPAAAIVNRLADGDLLAVPFLKEAAWTIFAVIPVLFAISVAGGIAKDKNVAAGLSGFIIYEVLVRTLGELNESGLNAFGRAPVENVRSNILLGIVAGILAGIAYNQFKDVQLPSGLSFFSGRRLVAIMALAYGIIATIILSFIFPPINNLIYEWGVLLGEMATGPFWFSFTNRLLIPTGLHHIPNAYIQFQLPSALAEFAHISGEIPRFFAGDPTAGTYVSGGFAMMMFGLPGAAFAMYRRALPENKEKVKGLLLGAAFTSFLTGITEPIEFSFIFASPILFVLHGILNGIGNVLMNVFDVAIVGVGGSGLIDYILQFNAARNPLLLLVVGAISFCMYYFSFSFLIKRFDIKTPGREAQVDVMEEVNDEEKPKKILEYLGGSENIEELDNCITRLRLVVNNLEQVNTEKLKGIGMREVIKMRGGKVQVVVGLEVEQLAPKIQKLL